MAVEGTFTHRGYTFDVARRTAGRHAHQYERYWWGRWFDASGEYRTYAMVYPDTMTTAQVADRARRDIDTMIPDKLLNRDEV